MQFTLSATTLLACAGAVLAQSPNGTTPATNNRLGVTYNTTVVTPGLELPVALVQSAPRLTGAANATGTFMVAMVDLSIMRTSVTNSSTAVVVAGVGTNRTTRLHWLQTGLTTSNGTLTVPSNVTAAAPYAAPAPPLNDTAHVYAFYLFNQPSNFTVPSAISTANYAGNSTARYNFSLTTITSIGGVALQSANWIYVQNAANAGAVTNSSGSNATLARNGTAATTSSAGAAATTTAKAAAAHVKAVLPAIGLGAVAMAFL